MARYLGIVFERHDNSYQAKITIVDETLGEDVIRDVLVDIYMPGITLPLYEMYTWWYLVDYDDHEYSIYVSNGGAGACPDPTGTVSVDRYVDRVTLDPAKPMASILLLWENERPHIHMFADISQSLKTKLTKEQPYVSTGVETTFTLSDENTASAFDGFSIDGGVTWKTPFDLSITWGSNSPTYDDQLIDIDGFFTIRFFTAPSAGSVIIIRYFPAANKARVYTIFDLARSSDGVYIDNKVPSRILSYSLELFN